jgi:hypothetical protein
MKFNPDKLRFNNYEIFDANGKRLLEKYTIDNLDSNPPAGPVKVLCDQCLSIDGFLLEGDALFMKRDALFHTRKIQTDSPLCKKISSLPPSLIAS